MSNKLKYSQLAKALGSSNASISMAIKNKMLIAVDKTIDIDLPFNKLWIENQEAKGKVFDLNKIFNKPEKSKPVANTKSKKKEPEQKDVTIENLRELEIKKKKKELQKLDGAIKLDQLKIKKQEGMLIPYNEVEFLLNYIIEKIRGTSIQEIDSIANIYKERFDISHLEYIEVKKDLTDIVNGIIKDSIKEMQSGIKGIQEKYQEVRSVGESK